MLTFYTEYLDKTLINYANVMGLQVDANITGAQFSQLAMIFYVSYLACEFPHAYGMQTLPTAKYLGMMVALVSQPSEAGVWVVEVRSIPISRFD